MKGFFDESIWSVKTYCWGKEGHTDIIKFLVDAQAAQRKKGPSLTSGKDEAQQSLMREKKRILDMKDDEGVNLSCNFSDRSLCICQFFPTWLFLFGCSDTCGACGCCYRCYCWSWSWSWSGSCSDFIFAAPLLVPLINFYRCMWGK